MTFVPLSGAAGRKLAFPDNGSELTSKAILKWTQMSGGVDWHYIAPGKLQQNAFLESFSGRPVTSASMRRCLGP